MRRRHLLGAAASVAAAGLAAPRRGMAQPARGGVLKFIPQSDLSVLDPVWTAAYVTRNHGFMVFDTLFGMDDGYKPVPQMVEGVRVEDPTRITLSLRSGLRWHDGEPVLARDCVASIRRWGARDGLGQSLMAATDALTAPDDRTIEFRLKRPFPLLTAALGKPQTNFCPMMPERLALTDPFKQVSEMVGSGPYRFVADERVPGSLVVYRRNEAYVPRDDAPAFTAGGKRAHFDRVEWHVLPDPATAAAAMQSGEMDWWENPTFDLLPLLATSRALTTAVGDPSGFIACMRMNQLQPPFDNPALRRALLGAVDQRDYMEAVGGDDTRNWRVGVGVFCPDTPMANDAGMAALTGPRDMNAVRKAVVASGYRGERVVMMSPSDIPTIKALSDVCADMLQRAGLTVDNQVMDWGSLLQRLAKTEPVQQGGWSVTCTYWAGLDQLNPAIHAFLRGNGRAASRGWPTSAALEDMRTRWMDATSLDDQKRIAREMQVQAFADVPYIPLGQAFPRMAYRADLADMLHGFPIFWNVRRG